MEVLRRKVLIAILWVIYAMAMSVYMCLSFLQVEILQGITAGTFLGVRIDQRTLLWFGLYWFVPWILAVLTLSLKGSACRWMNLVLGTLLSVCFGLGTVIQAMKGQPVAIVVDYGLAVGATMIIAWNAWKLQSGETTRASEIHQ